MTNAGVAHLVERRLAKAEVAGSSPVSRSICIEYPIGGILCKCEYNLGYLLLPYLRHKPRRAVISLREPESTASTSYAGIV